MWPKIYLPKIVPLTYKTLPGMFRKLKEADERNMRTNNYNYYTSETSTMTNKTTLFVHPRRNESSYKHHKEHNTPTHTRNEENKQKYNLKGLYTQFNVNLVIFYSNV